MTPEGNAPITLSRQQLYEKIWTTPATKLAREYGISDVALGKACRRHRIPKPPLGYWAAKQFGKASAPPPLPAIEDQKLKTVTFHKQKAPKVIPVSSEIQSMAAAERASQPITVPQRTGPLHPLVARTKAAMTDAHANYRGIVTAYEKGCLGISVGAKSVGRAIRIMNALVRALEAKGFPVSAGLDDKRKVTVVKIYDEELMFRLEEGQSMKKRVKRPGDTYFNEGFDYMPSGKLVLTITNLSWTGARQRWRDTARMRLENQLNSFVAGLIAATEIVKIKRLEQERREREREEEHQRRIKEELLRIDEEKRMKGLDRVVSNWQKSRDIRSFCDDVVRRIPGKEDGIKPDSNLGKWLAWARKKADEFDPIRADCIVIPAS